MKKLIAVVAVLCLVGSFAWAKPSSSGSSSSFSRPSSSSSSSFSRPSSSSSSSSRPSSSSSSFSKPSSPSSSFSKPSSSSSGSSFSKPSSSKPSSSGFSKPSPSASDSGFSKPKTNYDSFGGRDKAKEESKVSYDKHKNKPDSGFSNPNPSPSKSATGFRKPKTNYDSFGGRDKAKEESKIAYERSKEPKSEYKSASGHTVKIDAKSPSTQRVRNITPEQYQNRTVIVENHYHNHYGSRYDYYRSQPPIYIGGGYSSLFWYAMLDWDIHRQAMWLYNNEQRFHNGELNRELYEQRLRNDALRLEVERLRRSNIAQDANYVDPEFRDLPLAMYEDDFVQSAYNPDVPGSSWWIFWTTLIILLVVVGIAYLCVSKRNW